MWKTTWSQSWKRWKMQACLTSHPSPQKINCCLNYALSGKRWMQACLVLFRIVPHCNLGCEEERDSCRSWRADQCAWGSFPFMSYVFSLIYVLRSLLLKSSCCSEYWQRHKIPLQEAVSQFYLKKRGEEEGSQKKKKRQDLFISLYTCLMIRHLSLSKSINIFRINYTCIDIIIFHIFLTFRLCMIFWTIRSFSSGQKKKSEVCEHVSVFLRKEI